MTTIEESIDIDVPVAVAYNQWTQSRPSRSSWTVSSAWTRRPTRAAPGRRYRRLHARVGR